MKTREQIKDLIGEINQEKEIAPNLRAILKDDGGIKYFVGDNRAEICNWNHVSADTFYISDTRKLQELLNALNILGSFLELEIEATIVKKEKIVEVENIPAEIVEKLRLAEIKAGKLEVYEDIMNRNQVTLTK